MPNMVQNNCIKSLNCSKKTASFVAKCEKGSRKVSVYERFQQETRVTSASTVSPTQGGAGTATAFVLN